MGILERFQVTEDGDIKASTVKYPAKWVVKRIAVVLIVLFFFPLCTVSCGGYSRNINGLQLTFGIEDGGDLVHGNLLCIVLLLIPIFIFAVFSIRQIEGMWKKYICVLAVSAVHLIMLAVCFKGVKSAAEEYGAEARFTIWYFLTVLGVLLTGGISAIAIMKLQGIPGIQNRGIQNSLERVQNIRNRIVERKEPITNTEEIRICHACGRILESNMNFCPGCGTAYKDPLAGRKSGS